MSTRALIAAGVVCAVLGVGLLMGGEAWDDHGALVAGAVSFGGGILAIVAGAGDSVGPRDCR